jgi:uncharacterized delta-60 repeat protein
MRTKGPCLALVAGAVVACSSFSEADNAPADAGADGPPSIPGVPIGALAVSVSGSKQFLTHGRTERVPVTITRKAETGAVVISARGLPDGVRAISVTVSPGRSAVDLEVVVERSAKQGDVAGAVVEAANVEGTVKAEAPLPAFVRGSPGEIDTTFATNGILTLTAPCRNFETAMEASGKIVVAGGYELRRFTVDGAPDATFGKGGVAALPTSGAPVRIAVSSNGIFVARTGSAAASFDKLKPNGDLDTAYGGGDGAFEIAQPIYGAAIAADGRVAAFDSTLPTRFTWASSAGAKDPAVPDGESKLGAFTPRAGVYVPDGLVVVGNEGYIEKLKSAGGGLDPSFASNGSRQIAAGAVLNDVVQDAQGRFVVTGYLTGTKGLVLARAKADGTDSLPPSTSSFAVKAVTLARCEATELTEFAGRLALQKDGKILQAAQVDDQGVTKCVVARYAESGVADDAFGEGGKSVLSVPGCVAKGIHVQPDGRIVVAGELVVRIWN